MIVELIRDIFDLLLDRDEHTSRVCSFPLSEAGLEPKELPVSFISIKIL